MTPLLPSPQHYLYNLISMTNSDAKKLWRRAIKEHFNCQCVYCGNNYEINELTIDHVKPKSNGGESIASNLVPACRSCNQGKGSSNWLGWMRSTYGRNHSREQLILNHIS
jgi:CRISPR/Cas system Type II protein with McrA/HNH and RuvC-like nuclease domain